MKLLISKIKSSFITQFLLTSAFANVVVFIILLKKIFIEKIYINYKYILFTCFFVISYLITFNFLFLRTLALISFTLIIIDYLKKTRDNNNLYLIFYLHTLIILATILSPSLNQLLVGEKFTSVRFSGLIPGFDFVPLFYSVFVITLLIKNNFSLNFKSIILFLISFAIIILSGRFGLIYILYILFLFLLKKSNLKTLLILIVMSAITFILFRERIEFVYYTFNALYNSIINLDVNAFENLNYSDEYYSSSPLTLIYELTFPFRNISSYLFPSNSFRFLDPGISYYIINLGLIISIFIYMYFFNLFKNFKKKYLYYLVPLILCDIKFQSIFVTMPMFWVMYNINYLSINNES